MRRPRSGVQAPNQSISAVAAFPLLPGPALPVFEPVGEGERVEKFEYALFPIAHLKPDIERSGITLIRPGKLENELIASFSKYAIFLISRSE